MAKKQELKEYIVTLKNKEDLDLFYDDMESDTCKKTSVPKRKISCLSRRNVSRNTHYLLTDAEAEKLKNDERVLSIELTMEEQGIHFSPQFIQEETSSWAKNSQQNNNHRNWALLRMTRGSKIQNWGSNGTTLQSGKIVVPNEGRGVDIILVDGHTNPDHPEFKTEQNGTGQNRITNFNWMQYNSALQTPLAFETYTYPPYEGTDNNHGSHVFGIIAGNRNGWARSANLYQMSPYGTNPNTGFSSVLWDYIRAFHNTKLENSSTGVKTPTITNHSYGTFLLKTGGIPFTTQDLVDGITEISFRGQTILPPYTAQILSNCGIVPIAGNSANGISIPIRVPSIDVDVEDAIADGVIVVGAAGNSSFKIDVPGGIDYNNSFVLNGTRRFYHRGSSPTAANGAICVGSISSLVDERKAAYSNCGPRVDVYAPGDLIQSIANEPLAGTVQDSRDPAFYLRKLSGTSMAGPQVCGIIATVLETYPSLTQAEVLEYITKKGSKSDQILDSVNSFSDLISLQGSSNKYAYYYPERAETGKLSPKTDFFVRPQNGVVYPRLRKRRRNEN